MTANVSAHVKYVNSYACQNYLRKIAVLCISDSTCQTQICGAQLSYDMHMYWHILHMRKHLRSMHIYLNILNMVNTYVYILYPPRSAMSGATELIPFLIWQYYPKWFWKAGGEKVKVVRFGWFDLYHMQNLRRIRISISQVLILPVYPAIPKMV